MFVQREFGQDAQLQLKSVSPHLAAREPGPKDVIRVLQHIYNQLCSFHLALMTSERGAGKHANGKNGEERESELIPTKKRQGRRGGMDGRLCTSRSWVRFKHTSSSRRASGIRHQPKDSKIGDGSTLT
jgi:hypothetical protein